MLPKLFIFGIDGGTFDIVDPLIKDGYLPNLAALLSRGASAKMGCTRPAHTAPGWASFVTANYPGHHGVYQFFHTQTPDYGARIVKSTDFGCSTMWDWLAQQGWTMGLINIPMSHPPRSLPGYQITWPLSNTLRYSKPPALLGEMAKNGAHFQSDLAVMYKGDLNYIHEAIDNVDARLRSLFYLLDHHPVDAVMIVFTEVDRVCHHYWHFSDPGHLMFTQEADVALHSAIRDIYKAVDNALGEALKRIPAESSVVVISDHGFGPGHQSFAIHRCLEDAGLLATRPSANGGNASVSSGEGMASWFVDGGREIDWSGTRLYMPVPGSFGINVNLKGRQVNGIVAETDRAQVMDDAVELLSAIRNPSNGKPAFAEILRREEAFPGPQSQCAPDLLLVPEDESLMVVPAVTGDIWGQSYQTGLHQYEGMWIHASPHVKAGRLARSVRIVDAAPTLLTDLGVSFPKSIQGEVIGEIFSGTPATAPLDLSAVSPQHARHADEETPRSDNDSLILRLQEMGYL